MRARAPFSALLPAGRSLRDRTLRRYLASFGIDSPPRIEADRRDAGAALVEAAALPEVACTVWSNVFEIARLQAGEVLLVHGGTSGIGTLAIQLAVARGARVLCTVGSAEKAARAEELSGRIMDVCLQAGGSITGEHGVGVDKKRYMAKMFAEADLDAFQRLRCAFDPAGLANPGKVMPTPRLCGEVPGIYREHPLEAAGLAERF